MAALTIKFNYVRDYAVLYREDFIKYVGTILPKTIKRDHVNDVIVRCKRTASDPSKQTDINVDLPTDYADDYDKEYALAYFQKMLTPLIKKIPEIAHNSGTTIEREPEFDITIVVK